MTSMGERAFDAPGVVSVAQNASVSTASKQITSTPDGIHVSPLDDRQYKYLELPNGLHALVISDPVTESASAAMDVSVGFNSDPDDIPGLAHFCEHMLFLGTEKYPDENSYSGFLTSHGGSSNAYTSARNTNYYFDVGAKHLREALDRFAQFFLTPLFTIDATDREMNAVDSEYMNYLQDDYWRMNQLHHTLGNPKHPFHRFGVGNLKTLSETPKERGIDVRAALLKYYETYYSANMMRLVVYGKEDVETLSQWVHDIFGSIRHNGRSGPPDFSAEQPFTEAQLGRRVDVLPVKDLKLVSVTWLLPSLRGKRYTQQHTSIITHLIGHEGEGSLLSLLKKHKWVHSISASIEEDLEEFATMGLHIEMTDEGMMHVDDLLLALFQYVQLLRESKLEKWMFQELEDLSLMHFLFQSKQSPMSYTSSTAQSMQIYGKRDILTQNGLYFPYEPEAIQELLALMTPERTKVFAVCKSFEGVVDQEEPWYGTKYRDFPLDVELLAKLRTPGLHKELFLPKPNEFVASDFTLIDKQRVLAVSSPIKLRDDAWTRVWYKPDTHFKKPRTHASLTFYSPLVNGSPLSFVLSDLFVLCVQDELTEYSYDASLAGMYYDLAVQGNCVHLGAVGFSAKIDVLVFRIVEMMRSFPEQLQEETFERAHESVRRYYDNVKLDEAYRLAMQDTTAIMQEKAWTTEDLITATASVDIHMLRRHSERLLEQFFLEAFVYGNIYEDGALQLVDNVLKTIKVPRAKPLLRSQHSQLLFRQLQLPERVEHVLQKTHPNADNLNCAVDCVYQIGEETMRERVSLAVFSQLVYDPLFNQLRTKEQLGYTVFSTPARMGGTQWFRVIIQSNVASPEYVLQRLDAFWRDMERFIKEEMTTEQLNKYIQAIVKEYTEKPKSQEEEVQGYTAEIALREYRFDRKEQLAKLVQTVTRQDVLGFLKDYILPEGQHVKKLSVCIYGGQYATIPELCSVDPQAQAFNPDTQTGLLAALTLGMVSETKPKPLERRHITEITAFKEQRPFYGLPAAFTKPSTSHHLLLLHPPTTMGKKQQNKQQAQAQQQEQPKPQPEKKPQAQQQQQQKQPAKEAPVQQDNKKGGKKGGKK
ncbi:hypothetical protein Poli38472_012128 [Pythium oligandrum]|uniref:Insulin-degrading enzyme n=1 Tax=Pythium oligandrum TaxID=41045 RepID=A0A8K1CNW1_PYTOL|nr:hypothetical protein Poli38472_012128 [Pythium oligandrum]|eukprot:TMW67012.1 hypothetical protein Poli38472_012128 [Pythium oligandrum]